MDMGAVEAPRFEGPKYANGHDNRYRYREVGFSSSRSCGGRSCDRSPQAQAPLRFVIFSEVTTVPRWHRSLRLIPSLVARTAGPWSCGAPDATGLRAALRQTAEE